MCILFTCVCVCVFVCVKSDKLYACVTEIGSSEVERIVLGVLKPPNIDRKANGYCN